MKEHVNVEKETVVAEEVGVHTEAVERTERVQETVRREQLEVEDSEGLATESGRTTTQPYEHERSGGLRRD
jgi:stress response protein YsnF